MSQPSETPNNESGATEPIDAMFAEVKAFARKQAAMREVRRRQFEEKQPNPKWSIVAWIDLLGFGDQISKADTPEKFQAAYRRMREVHEEFGKETASVHADQAEVNEGIGKRVIALSDGLVIALNLERDCPDAQETHIYDRIGSFLEDLRMAQARCASAGIIMRGGVALGYFWHQDDILLSPALVSAYEMESKKTLAKNPVIILRRDLAESIRALRTKAGYSEDLDPMHNLFRDCDWMEESARAEYVMLNFMPVFTYEDDPTPFLQRYHEHLISMRASAPVAAKPKYDWLMQYAREFVRAKCPAIEEQIFGATSSQPATSQI
jgi:hypothetical protein